MRTYGFENTRIAYSLFVIEANSIIDFSISLGIEKFQYRTAVQGSAADPPLPVMPPLLQPFLLAQIPDAGSTKKEP